ncbi:3-oxoacyl-[acyl-carrier-protein] reductase FabG [Labrenzia sp. THAF82]|uniref:SDR family oxidoreductase n=1 Tax=Labrenzia sp. THAF82 TaxID=2587861 RepID=UPI00126938A9|nr:SDR family oxidoreductase [Labrenzia sp. THAF82]QFT32788.1 3-oxoacyl-[acyl-carrier-protein] reductase FabG [Labrenzia sp. THAF82]
MADKKTVFLTGSGGVLGTVYIEKFLKNGMEVIASELPGERYDGLMDRYGDHDCFHCIELDVGSEEQVAGVFKSLATKNLFPNVVINNAAVTGELLMGRGEPFPDFANTKLETWEKTLKVNLTGAFLVARQMDVDIVGRYPAKLINVASMYALNGPHHDIYEGMPFKSFSAYSATKAGIHGLTVWLAGYWAKRDCTVNTIAPGAVFNDHSVEFQCRVGKLIMLDRMAEPEEIADAMTFLVSDNSRYMTGQIVNVDGGFSAW